ncbi:hypothetical protein B0181_05720 [Moraxella caviae]|uniref:Uncharacterized protein n=2 Tax=Moraxella caviae TaxID=34060 RepID=A0A1T0A2N9_9GAMM|nr:hypothetical protein B0181_05720 [Moraxella caviae]STZ14292.1 Uncharacterised protein [Moraxella caviae]VEW10764.1 Uncharacterised protein [Moraxella caviae]
MTRTKITLALALMLGSLTAHANTVRYESPAMRGEITTTVTYSDAADLLKTSVRNLPTPKVQLANVEVIDTVLTPANTAGTKLLDTTLMDEFIADVSPNARHYPPNFPNATTEYLATQNAKHLSDWIEPFANAPDASFDVLMRAAKLNGIARNLNAGTDYSVRAANHVQKALKMQPNDVEANLLFGIMLSEGGGFEEGKKYLDKAAAQGSLEAEQSLAQSDLLTDKKDSALNRLKKLQAANPDNAQIAEQVKIVENGGYYIWRIANNNINLKHYR